MGSSMLPPESPTGLIFASDKLHPPLPPVVTASVGRTARARAQQQLVAGRLHHSRLGHKLSVAGLPNLVTHNW
jgi:hypothetical protein